MIAAALALGAAIATASPSPTTSTCTRDIVAAEAVQPDYPDAARGRNYGNLYVLVKVDVSATGAVTGTSIEHSSGDTDIDKAAIRAATESTYLPKIENCKAVSGYYIFRADFDRVR